MIALGEQLASLRERDGAWRGALAVDDDDYYYHMLPSSYPRPAHRERDGVWRGALAGSKELESGNNSFLNIIVSE